MYKLGRGEVIVEKLKRLTEMTTSGGWAAKIGPEVLASVLSQLPKNENNNKNNFEPIEHYYHSLLEHLGWKNLGEIYAGGVMGIGDIKGHPALEDVKKLALSI